MSDAPVTRPDLDALIAAAYRDINDANRCQTMGIMPATHQLHRRLREVTAALAAERARADQAVQLIAEAHDACLDCAGYGHVRIAIDDAVPCENPMHSALPAAPTAAQEADH